jgi:hypothetical protein
MSFSLAPSLNQKTVAIEPVRRRDTDTTQPTCMGSTLRRTMAPRAILETRGTVIARSLAECGDGAVVIASGLGDEILTGFSALTEMCATTRTTPPDF